jgi:hypothetical protein
MAEPGATVEVTFPDELPVSPVAVVGGAFSVTPAASQPNGDVKIVATEPLAGYTTEPLAIFQGELASVYPTTTEGFGLSILEAL